MPTASEPPPSPSKFALIVGAGKCGTTSLFHYLGSHPEISKCEQKEPNFFCDEARFSRGPDWYVDLWDWDPELHEWALEASVDYANRPRYGGTVERVERYQDEQGASFKFLYIVRDPIERIESHITASWNARHGPLPSTRNPLDGRPLFPTCYAEQIRPFSEAFGNSVLVLTLHDLEENPRETLSEVAEFLDIDTDHSFDCVEDIRNESVQKYKPGKLWEAGLQLGLGGLVDWIPETVSAPLRRLLGEPISEKYRLTEDEEAFLRTLLDTEMENLETRHDIDPSRWNRWQQAADRPKGPPSAEANDDTATERGDERASRSPR